MGQDKCLGIVDTDVTQLSLLDDDTDADGDIKCQTISFNFHVLTLDKQL